MSFVGHDSRRTVFLAMTELGQAAIAAGGCGPARPMGENPQSPRRSSVERGPIRRPPHPYHGRSCKDRLDALS